MESAHRTSLAKGEVGIREKKAVPTLKDFLKKDFLRFAETRHATKAMTLRYYKQGSDMLLKSAMAGLRLDELSDHHVSKEHSSLTAAYLLSQIAATRRDLIVGSRLPI
jgi:hypothetical protein